MTYLVIRFSDEADEHEDENGPQVVDETGPVVDTESGYEGTHQHEENGTRTQNSSAHQHTLRQHNICNCNSISVQLRKCNDEWLKPDRKCKAVKCCR